MNSKENNGLLSGLKTNQKYILALMAFLAVCLVICLIVLVIASIDFAGEEPDANLQPDTNSYTIENTKAYTPSSTELLQGPLVVVNKNNKFNLAENAVKLVDPYQYRLDNEADAKNPAYRIATNVSIMLTAETTANLHNMLTDLNSSTGKVALIATAHRTLEAQKEFPKPASPGYSDFHTGMLVSLKVHGSGASPDLTAEGNEAMYNWLLTNAHKYGFVQRYPAGKEAATGVSDYLSCFRYVGIAHATYMKTNNLTLEEYIAKLKETKPTLENPLRIETKSGTQSAIYAVYYYDFAEGEIQIPESNYTISGTNMGGIVVTVKLK